MSHPPPPPPPPMGSFVPPLPPGWTEHRAPAGQPYWFNPSTNVSTYTRPLPPPGFFPPPPPHHHHHHQPNAPPTQLAPPLHFPSTVPTTTAPTKEKKEKKEKPKTKTPIEGTVWTKVVTNKGNTFYTNRETKESVWTVPEEIKEVVEELERVEKEKEKEESEGRGTKREREEDDDDEGAEEGDDIKEGEDVKIEVEGASGSLAEEKVTEPEPEKEPPKKKKQKKMVVRDIEEMEGDEDWQREIAEKMAAEVAAEDNAMLDDGDEKKDVTNEEVVVKKVEEATTTTPAPTASIPPPRGAAVPRLDVSPEEGAAFFKAMLAEKDINPMAPWDMELTRFVNDPRYLAVKQLRDRRDLFDEFCKVKIREIRAAKKAAQESGEITKIDPLTAYRNLLQTAVTSTRTHFSDFKRSNGKDPRFREFGKTEGEKEKVFKAWLRELGEKKRVEAKKAEERFVEMLKEDKEIKSGDKWSEVKTRHSSDPRYEAVNSSSLRESLFTQFLTSSSTSSSSAPSTSISEPPSTASTKADRAARAAASLKEREEQVRAEKAKVERNANAARGALGREEGEREFRTLLIDVVRDHEARWDSVVPALEPDPRFSSSNLSPHDKRRLFDLHLSTLYQKRLDSLEALFLTHAPTLNTPFSTVLPLISTSNQATRLIGSDERRLEGLYLSWLKKRESTARQEFEELLKESPIIDHWGRLQKENEEKGEKGLEIKDEEEEEDDAAIDLKDMAKQIDLKAIHAVLKHDKRYLIFDHEPEKRNQWIKDFVANLSAPKLTAHQRD